jgi:hypothetical protein
VTTREEEERQRELRRRLDDLVGTDFDAPHVRTFSAWIRSRWIKWALGVLFAIGAPLAILYTIESHRLPPVTPPPAKKPVTVQIIPARP